MTLQAQNAPPAPFSKHGRTEDLVGLVSLGFPPNFYKYDAIEMNWPSPTAVVKESPVERSNISIRTLSI